MDIRILLGLILFTLALLLYSIATWAGVITGRLKKWHIILFWIGFSFDFSGTISIGSVYGGFVMNMHSYLGALALIVILVQNIVGTKILIGKNEKWIVNFPKKVFLPVWVLWMTSYIAGMILSGGSH